MSDFAKSSKLILSVLNSHGTLSQFQIAHCSRIPKRTVRHNLRKMREANLVREKIAWNDLRQKLYEPTGVKR